MLWFQLDSIPLNEIGCVTKLKKAGAEGKGSALLSYIILRIPKAINLPEVKTLRDSLVLRGQLTGFDLEIVLLIQMKFGLAAFV